MIRIHKSILFCFCLSLLFTACESEFVPTDIDETEFIVVEGHIEAGVENQIPYVILTNSIPFFNELSPEEFEGIFINDALVKVNDGDKDVSLPSICLDDLPPELKEEVARELGLDPENLNVNICIYADVLMQLNLEEGRTYQLLVEVDDQVLRSSTTIPQFVPLDSLWFQDAPGEPSDTLLSLWANINDPSPQVDFYRYFTGNVGEPLTIPLQSVTDDIFFDGQSFDFPLNKAEARNSDFDPNTFGLFNVGDTVIIKWCNIDQEHFDFWLTLEYSLNSQGPFASYTRVKTNIDGGLGIWGGYACKEYEVVVQK